MATKAASKKTPRAKTGATTLRVETLRAQAFKMKLQGLSGEDVGQALGISRARVCQLVQEELEVLRSETLSDSAQYRLILTQKALTQLGKGEQLQDKALAKVAEEDGAVDLPLLETANAIMKTAREELAKLWGAYAATKVESKSTVQADVTSNGSTVGAAAVANLSTEALEAIRQAHLLAMQAQQT